MEVRSKPRVLGLDTLSTAQGVDGPEERNSEWAKRAAPEMPRRIFRAAHDARKPGIRIHPEPELERDKKEKKKKSGLRGSRSRSLVLRLRKRLSGRLGVSQHPLVELLTGLQSFCLFLTI
ncbi:Hypothetical predicted protein [Xyrichtys novacula]|uniref:Uncharacterized protein n=1 Tax=Xyrichtys novacula TaxID=13765 RepID=A0AAV1FNM7_XYRNO|nr:Hypothetical predicted protein [Xyrichtys novacula]